MKEPGLRSNDLASLEKMEWAKLNAAGNAAIAKLSPPRVGWSPTVDKEDLDTGERTAPYPSIVI